MHNHDLITNIGKVQTTGLGRKRIARNLGLTADCVAWCKEQILQSDSIERRGKNWYVKAGGAIITVNANSYTIITAHKDKKW